MFPRFYLLLLFCNLISLSVRADYVGAYSILRTDDGQVKLIKQGTEFNTCPEGTYLPTLRELAKETESWGAKGVLELNAVNQIPPGYRLIRATDQWGNKDEFYYSFTGCKLPTEIDGVVFWMASYVITVGETVFNAVSYANSPFWYNIYPSNNEFPIRCFLKR